MAAATEQTATIIHKLQSLPIRSKLLAGYLATFLIIIVIGHLALYFYVRETIKTNIESELSNSTTSILNMVKTATDASITNHLRAIAEKNLEIVVALYNRQQNGELTTEQAQEMAARILGSQTIGKTGYLYCVDSQGIIRVHTNRRLIGTDLSSYDFIALQKKRRTGYLEYDWANPGESHTRPKALYMTYFGPWDWIISASSYRDEFNVLVDMDDLRRSILSIRFGETGYAYVMDSDGNLIIHPQLEGTNIYDSEDSDGHKFIREICERKNGSIIYPWKNPGEPDPRLKLVFFNYLEKLDWIVASSSYLEEFYRPLRTVTYLIVTSVVLMIFLSLPLTWAISASITRPLEKLMHGLDAAAHGDFTKRMRINRHDELGKLAAYFDTTMHQLETSNTRLTASERNFRSIFENSIEGIFQCESDGRIVIANPSFAAMAGYNVTRSLLQSNVNFARDMMVVPDLWPTLLRKLRDNKAVKSYEMQLRQKSGEYIWCMLNARPIYDNNEEDIIRIEGFLSDIDELKRIQEAQKEIQEQLEQRVEKRTAELSGWVAHLERQDAHNQLMSEMSEMLQSCRSVAETYPIIDQYLHVLFVEDRCSLYLATTDQTGYIRRVPRTDDEQENHHIHTNDCWALRQSKPYHFLAREQKVTCVHIDNEPASYLCIPLLAHGLTTGLLCVQSNHNNWSTSASHSETLDGKLKLGLRITENLALALANLKLREELEELSLKDSLTGLSNRRHLEDVMQRQLSRQRRHGTPFAVLMLDVDHFKQVNDTYGHETGDEVLVALADHLRQTSRGEDLCCRFGGEEFTLILDNSNLEQAKKRAELVRTGVAEKVRLKGAAEGLRITISIGIAACPDHGEDPESLFKAADTALYQAKSNGRNRVETS